MENDLVEKYNFNYCSTHNLYFANAGFGSNCPACDELADHQYMKEQYIAELEKRDKKITDLENRIGDLEEAINSAVRDFENATADLEYSL